MKHHKAKDPQTIVLLKKLESFQKDVNKKKSSSKNKFASSHEEEISYYHHSSPSQSRLSPEHPLVEPNPQAVENKQLENLTVNFQLQDKIKSLQKSLQTMHQQRDNALLQVKELLGNLELEDISVVIAKGREYDKLQQEAHRFTTYKEKEKENFFKERFLLLKDSWEIYLKYFIMQRDLKKTKDDFQRIKVYRLFLKRLALSPRFTQLLSDFSFDDATIKDFDAVEKIIAKVKHHLCSKSEIERIFSFDASLEVALNDSDDSERKNKSIQSENEG